MTSGVQKQVEEIVALLESWLRAGEFPKVNDYLTLCQESINLMEPPLLVAILTITTHAKPKLSNRPSFVKAVDRRLTEVVGPVRAALLLEHRR